MFDPSSFSGRLPLFPLPDVVHFPHTLLPLHVFEPRYRAMVADALAGERLIGMVLLKPGWESGYEGNPEVHEIACLGRIARVETLDDGRYNLLLTGEARVRLDAVVSPLPYRTARVTVLPDRNDVDDWEDRVPMAAELKNIFRQIYDGLTAAAGAPPLKSAKEYTLGNVVDMISGTFDFDAPSKQELLGEPDVPVRAARLMAMIRDHVRRRSRISRSGEFPPRESDN